MRARGRIGVVTSVGALISAPHLSPYSLNRRAVVTVTPLAKIVPRVDALFPGLAAAVLGFTNRRLPESPGRRASRRALEGWQAEKTLSRRTRLILDRLTTLGRRAAARFNQERSGST